MEISYEETIEEVPTEVEVEEEIIEVREESTSETIEEVATTGGSSEQNQSIERNSNTEEISESRESRRESGSEEANAQTNTDIGSTANDDTEVSPMANQSVQVNVSDIRRQVENTIKNVDEQLVATQTLVAKVMSNNDMLNTYSTKNKNIFDNQLNINGGEYNETRNYIDTRNIYADISYGNQDRVQRYQKNIQEAVDDRIRAEQHLRRIRGY